MACCGAREGADGDGDGVVGFSDGLFWDVGMGGWELGGSLEMARKRVCGWVRWSGSGGAVRVKGSFYAGDGSDGVLGVGGGMG